MANASRDGNRIATLLGVSSSGFLTPITIAVNPITHAMLIDGASLTPVFDTIYLRLNTSNDPLTGDLMIDGSTDAIQLLVQGNATQTNALAVFENSAGADQFTFGNTGAFVANEQGNSVDFRVESDTNANMLFVKGSNNRVGIGRNDPQHELSVAGDIDLSGNIFVDNDKSQAFNDGQGGNNTLKSGSDGTFIFDINAGNSVKIKGGDSVGAEALFYTDGSFNTEWTVNTLGRSSQNGSAIINEEGQNSDTRIEGDTDANLVFVQASTDRVGIGNNAPGNKLDITGTIQADGIRLDQTPAAGATIPTHSVTMNFNGTTYRVPCLV